MPQSGQIRASEACGTSLTPDRGIAHPEVEGRVWSDPPERRHERIVGVQHEGGVGRQPLDRLRPEVGHEVDFAVAVKLIAEDVGEQNSARPNFLEGGGNGRLIDLEQANIGVRPAVEAALGDDRRDEAGHKVGAGPVVKCSDVTLTQDVGDQAARRRLAVRAGYQHGAVAQSPGDGAEGRRVDPGDDVASDDRATTTTESSTQARGDSASEERGGQTCTHPVLDSRLGAARPDDIRAGSPGRLNLMVYRVAVSLVWRC